jgi:hypothetical protein
MKACTPLGITLYTLDMALDSCRTFTFALLRGFLVELTATHFGQYTGFFAGTLESTQSDIEMFIVFDTYTGHSDTLRLKNKNWSSLSRSAVADDD